MTRPERQERQNIRNAYLVASLSEAKSGIKTFIEDGNIFGASCIVELMEDDSSPTENPIDRINQFLGRSELLAV